MSSVIKNANPMSGTVQPVAFNWDDLAQRGDKYLNEIRTHAARIIADAKRDADAIRKKAGEEGREIAMRSAEKVIDERIARQLATALPAIRRAVDQMEDSINGWISRWECEVVRLAKQMATKVIRREVAEHAEITLDLARDALQMVTGCTSVTVRLHPQDYEILQGQVETIAHEMMRVTSFSIVADEAIEQGSCRVDTQFGVVDQQFSAQLDRIEEELVG